VTIAQLLKVLNKIPIEYHKLEIIGLDSMSNLSYNLYCNGTIIENDDEQSGVLAEIDSPEIFMPIFLEY
jgi:hypothetical protein